MPKFARWWSFAIWSSLFGAIPAHADVRRPFHAETREALLEALEPPLLDAAQAKAAGEGAWEPCGSVSRLRLLPLSWEPLSFSGARAPLAPPGAGVTSTFGSLRVAELEEQRRTRLLDKLQLKPRMGGGSDLLTGDVAGVATLAAEALSLNLNLGRKRPNALSFDDSDPTRPSWSFGLGLGRLGLKLRSEW